MTPNCGPGTNLKQTAIMAPRRPTPTTLAEAVRACPCSPTPPSLRRQGKTQETGRYTSGTLRPTKRRPALSHWKHEFVIVCVCVCVCVFLA